MPEDLFLYVYVGDTVAVSLRYCDRFTRKKKKEAKFIKNVLKMFLKYRK